MKFTFKTEHPTGLYRSFYKSQHYIKFNKIGVGSIGNESPYSIRLKVTKEDINEDGCSNCEWKWIRLKGEFSSLDEAKTFLVKNTEAIMAKFKIHLTE